MNTRAKLIALNLFEGVRLVIEQDMQVAQQPQPMPQQTPPAQLGGDMSQPAPQGQAPAGSAVGADGQPLTVDSMIDRLNVIRGGKSFSDPEVYGQLTTMFKQLPDPDKMSLDKVLMEIGKVIVNAQENTQGGAQPPPAQNPAGQQQQPTMQGSQPATAAPAGGGAPQNAGMGAPPIAAM